MTHRRSFPLMQDSAAYKRSAEMATAARDKTASVWSSIASSNMVQNTSSRMGSAFGAAKTRISASMSQHNISGAAAGGAAPAAEGEKPAAGAADAAKPTNGTEAK